MMTSSALTALFLGMAVGQLIGVGYSTRGYAIGLTWLVCRVVYYWVAERE